MFSLNLLQYLTIYLYLTEVFSLETVNVKNLPLNSVSSLINKIQNKYGNNIQYVEIQPNIRNELDVIIDGRNTNSDNGIGVDRNNNDISKYNNKYNSYGKSNKNHKRILVKRLIPHGLPPSKLEFDGKYQTIFKPLVRIHKTKPAPKIAKLLNVDGNQNNIGINKYGIDIHDYFDNDEDVLDFVVSTGLEKRFQKYPVKKVKNTNDVKEQLLQPFTVDVPAQYTIDEDTQLKIIEELEKLVDLTRTRASRMKLYDYFLEALDRLPLRSYEKSGEENDPLAPGKKLFKDEQEEVTPKPKFAMPHYPPWNYWTYMKTIHQDVCPDGQVKIANLCVWIPPH